MEIKILQVFYDKNGLPYKDKERTVHYPITSGTFLGASNTTQIRFYYDQLDELNESTFVAVSKLPNGKIGSKILETEYDSELEENYAVLNLSSFYTQYKGDVYISLQGYQGGVKVEQDENGIYQIYGTPTIQATGSIKLSIAYAPTFVGSGETENITLQRVLAELSTKLGIRQETLYVEELPTVGNPNVWYVVNDDPSDTTKANIYIWNATTQTYVWVGDNTLNLGEYYKKEQGEQFESGIDNRVTSVENELSSVASGSPKGVYATLSDLESAYPTGTTGIYVVSADGHWYYWNSSAWTDGGAYLSSLPDTKLSPTSNNSLENNVIYDNIVSLSKNTSQLSIKLGTNLLNINACTSGVYFLSNGTFYTTSDQNYKITYPIFLKAGNYTERLKHSNYYGEQKYLIVDAKGNVLSIESATKVEGKDLINFTISEDCIVILNANANSYLVNGTYNDYLDEEPKFEYELDGLKKSVYDEGIAKLLNDIYIEKGTNLFDKNRAFLYDNKFFAQSYIGNDNNCAISSPILLEPGTYTVSSSNYYGSSNTYVLEVDYNGNILRRISGTKNDNYSPIVFSLDKRTYISINVLKTNIDSWQLVSGSYPTAMPNCKPYTLKIDGLKLNDYSYESPLSNKVWYACGDSATEGDFSSIETPIFNEGIYEGYKKVYPYYIGNRTGMVVNNIAVSGGTIATINDQPNRYQFSKDGNYNSVPTDTDIITIWFGANDMWQNVPIGTIDSNDSTTFYGAWNKVLSYYVNNYPNTKLGIVVSFWMTQQYAEAVIAVAAKYGVPILNMYNDPKVPVTVGSRRPDVADSVKSTRNNQWVVSQTNSHPSAKYHEIESYFIEEWLKTL